MARKRQFSNAARFNPLETLNYFPISLTMAKKNFGIPDDVLSEIMERDKNCAYCHKIMLYPYIRENIRDSATIEHLSPVAPFH